MPYAGVNRFQFCVFVKKVKLLKCISIFIVVKKLISRHFIIVFLYLVIKMKCEK